MINTPDLIDALQALADDKGISIDTLFGALADAFESAYKRLPNSQEYAWVIIDPDSGDGRHGLAGDLHPAARGVGSCRRADHEAGHEPAHP